MVRAEDVHPPSAVSVPGGMPRALRSVESDYRYGLALVKQCVPAGVICVDQAGASGHASCGQRRGGVRMLQCVL